MQKKTPRKLNQQISFRGVFQTIPFVLLFINNPVVPHNQESQFVYAQPSL